MLTLLIVQHPTPSSEPFYTLATHYYVVEDLKFAKDITMHILSRKDFFKIFEKF